ncbi:MAG TPA: response regulator [Pseudonocardiaceae bacterium]
MSSALSAVASLLWPLIVLSALIVFRKPLMRVINHGDFTVKIAGEEITVGDLSRQQTDMITDVQKQLTALTDRVTALEKEIHPAQSAQSGLSGTPAKPAAVSSVPEPGSASVPAPLPAPASPLPWGPPDEPEPVPATGLGSLAQSREKSAAGLMSPTARAPWERISAPAVSGDAGGTATGTATGTTTAVGTGAVGGSPASVPAARAAVAGDIGEDHTDGSHPGSWVPGQSYRPVGSRPKATGVLWVDDHVRRHAVELDRLQRNGVAVDTVNSTDAALDRLSLRRYQLIVSDMHRVENGQRVLDAGLRLTQAVRALDRDTPIVIFSTGPTTAATEEPVLAAGANVVTTSPTALFAELHRLDLI